MILVEGHLTPNVPPGVSGRLRPIVTGFTTGPPTSDPKSADDAIWNLPLDKQVGHLRAQVFAKGVTLADVVRRVQIVENQVALLGEPVPDVETCTSTQEPPAPPTCPLCGGVPMFLPSGVFCACGWNTRGPVPDSPAGGSTPLTTGKRRWTRFGLDLVSKWVLCQVVRLRGGAPCPDCGVIPRQTATDGVCECDCPATPLPSTPLRAGTVSEAE